MSKNIVPRLKILWVSHFLPYPPKGGALIRSYSLLSTLGAIHDIDLIAFAQRKLVSSYFPSYEHGLSEIQAQLSKFLRIKKIFPNNDTPTTRRLRGAKALISGQAYSMQIGLSKEQLRYFQEQIDWDSYDVVHIDTISLLPLIPREVSVPLVLNHHNIESQMMYRRAEKTSSYIKSNYFKNEARLLRRVEKYDIARFQAQLVCSEHDRQILLNINSSLNVVVVPNGIQVGKIENHVRAPTHPPKLIFIGGLDWYPNLDAVNHLLDKIWPKIRSQRTDVELHIIGKNPPSNLHKKISDSEGIFLHGFVADIAPFYKAASLYVCPIRDGGGTKLKVLDALAHGVPLVGYPEACEGIDIHHKRDAIIATTPEDFAFEIVRLLENPADAERLGESGRQLVSEHYDSAVIGKKLAQTYSSLASL